MCRPAKALLAALAIVLATLCAQALPTVAAQASTTPVTLGAYADGFAGTGTQLTQFESLLGNKVAVASSFRGWGDLFPDSAQQLDANTGHTLLVAWDMGATAATRFATFTSHAHDAYLAQEAATARAFGSPLYIRKIVRLMNAADYFLLAAIRQPQRGVRRKRRLAASV